MSVLWWLRRRAGVRPSLMTDEAARILVEYSGDGDPEDAPMWVWQALLDLDRIRERDAE